MARIILCCFSEIRENATGRPYMILLVVGRGIILHTKLNFSAIRHIKLIRDSNVGNSTSSCSQLSSGGYYQLMSQHNVAYKIHFEHQGAESDLSVAKLVS